MEGERDGQEREDEERRTHEKDERVPKCDDVVALQGFVRQRHGADDAEEEEEGEAQEG